MKCPVCGDAAEEIRTTFDGKSIRCPQCGEYDISGTLFDSGDFQKLGTEERRAALAKAKRTAQPGKRPMITTYSR
jgi:hypothetical protein